MDWKTVRKQYPKMIYHHFSIEEDEHTFSIEYDFEIVGLSSFHPTFSFPKKDSTSYKDYKVVQEAVFSLGMVELISYWKLVGPYEVIVECGHLDQAKKEWWKKLYFHGLGEFFYQNHIEETMDSFMSLSSTGKPFEGKVYEKKVSGNLIPIGGGKDSFVTLDLLKEYKEDNVGFVINPVISALNSGHAAGYDGNQFVVAKRTLDSNMLELNQKGYFNGHTPFSALVSFASYLVALVYGKQWICLSNEASANESTVKGSEVNHQYSKTFEYEQDFRWYVKEYLFEDISYFSLLRPLSELQIAGIFAQLKPYHSVFRSCNVGSKEGVWCGHCAKCLFVAVILSAYLSNSEIQEIFGTDILNDSSLLDLFEQLTGIQDNKPFECVGTREEVNIAICMYLKAHPEEVPYLYDVYQKSNYYDFYQEKLVLDVGWNEENNVPSPYQELIKQRLKEIGYES